jgi:hypothetical protein
MKTSVNEEPYTGPYIIDACTVIDYLKTEDWVLRLFSRHIGTVYIAEPVMEEEIRQLTSEDCKRLGIKIATPELAKVIEAGKWHGPISMYDALTMIMAGDNAWTIISSDRALSKQAAIKNVKCIRGLRPMIMLVSAGHLSGKKAIAIAQGMQEINSGFLNQKVLDDFREEISKAIDET